MPLPCAPGAVPPVTHVRSTLVTSSLQMLKERGMLEAYFTRLPAVHRETVRSTLAGTWLSLELAMAHYRACDALGYSPLEQVEIGRQVGAKIQGTMLGTLASLARQAGVTPWTFLGQWNRLNDRVVTGGGVAVSRLAPKEALVETYRVPLYQVPYFATAWRGVIQGLCELFCAKAYVKAGRLEELNGRMTYVVSWA